MMFNTSVSFMLYETIHFIKWNLTCFLYTNFAYVSIEKKVYNLSQNETYLCY